MSEKINAKDLTEIELKKEWKKRKERVANMKPLYDNNKHYAEVVARSKQKTDDVVIDPSIPPTKQDLIESHEAIRELEYQINKLKRDKKKTLTYHENAMKSKLQELKKERREKSVVERALAKQKEREKLAKKFNLTESDYNRITKMSYPLPESLRDIATNKSKIAKLPIGLFLFLILKKGLDTESG